MIKEIKQLQKVTARWYNTSLVDERTTMVHLHDGVLYISQREKPSDVWPPLQKLQLDAIAFVR